MQPQPQPKLNPELAGEAIEAAADLAEVYGGTASNVARCALGVARSEGQADEVCLWSAVLGMLERNGL